MCRGVCAARRHLYLSSRREGGSKRKIRWDNHDERKRSFLLPLAFSWYNCCGFPRPGDPKANARGRGFSSGCRESPPLPYQQTNPPFRHTVPAPRTMLYGYWIGGGQTGHYGSNGMAEPHYYRVPLPNHTLACRSQLAASSSIPFASRCGGPTVCRRTQGLDRFPRQLLVACSLWSSFSLHAAFKLIY
jgi:hypothetical protein